MDDAYERNAFTKARTSVAVGTRSISMFMR